MVATEEMHMSLCSIKPLLRLPVLYRAFFMPGNAKGFSIKENWSDNRFVRWIHVCGGCCNIGLSVSQKVEVEPITTYYNKAPVSSPLRQQIDFQHTTIYFQWPTPFRCISNDHFGVVMFKLFHLLSKYGQSCLINELCYSLWYLAVL